MNKDEIKSYIREKLSTRRIILFGAGKVARKFYEDHKDKLDISFCVSNLKKEWGEGAFLEELDVKKYKREEIRENDYIIVCGPIAFRTIELQLMNDGFKMYEHFVEANIARVVNANKKIALFYGSCILRDMYRCLIEVPSFDFEYESVFTQSNRGQAVVNNRLLYYLKDICDLYVYTPRVLDRDSAYFLAPDELPADCKVVSVSNLVAPLYWPQVERRIDVHNQFYLHPYNVKRNVSFYHTLYRREDQNINKMILEGKTSKQIVECLSSDEFYSREQVDKHFRVTLKLIDIAEQSVEIKISDFIRENYRKVMLYQNAIHPNKIIICEYIRRLFKAIGVSTHEIESFESQWPLHIHQSGDVPIYPSVVKNMNLEFVEDEKKYEILTGRGVQYMTFEEYTEHYVEYTRKAAEIMNMWQEM